ncbi:GPI mannosyltransferase 3-like isoform X3 [Macrobrachium nipponense]|uniref:GPI mannosyltransferase 3-like isoform X3 n=1 Tax=Macrobrachium nipponense TaxID=159736 RepID=UPI0030C80A25
MVFLLVRLLSVLFIQTWFVADEYWQATEIAHHMAFGYGYQTWEWQHGIRSAVYPAIFGFMYKVLHFVKLDYPLLLVELPRVIHAVAFSIGDYHTWKLSKELYSRDSASWTIICLISSWFLEYCAPRTLTSSAETVLTSVALCYYPWKKKQESYNAGYLWLVGAACVIRPTAAILFVPLCLEHIWKSRCKQKLGLRYFIIIATVLLLSVGIDSWYYGRLVVVPWRFAHFNIVSGLSSHYGTHPWHWYLTQGIPATLTTHLVPFLLAVVYCPGRHKALLPVCLWSVFAYRAMIILIFLILPNGLALVYLGLVHQRGPLDAISVLRKEIASHKNPSVLFLMPCHSTPYYSHLHRDVPLRFLTCEPNLKYEVNYTDEADVFEKNPLDWLYQEYGITEHKLLNRRDESLSKHRSLGDIKPLPTHILLFDVLLEKIDKFLEEHKFHLCHRIYNSLVVDGRRSKYILIFCR